MRCLNPRTVGFESDGKTIAWSQKKYSKEYATFQLPCSKCIECRLEYARQWAVRCVHEAQMHENNSFITLTYDDKHLKSNKLIYSDFQLFVKKLRKHIFKNFLKSYGEENWKLLDKEERKKLSEQFQISIFVTGEYGDKRKRPHWHALIFNWRPEDCKHKYTNDNGDRVYESSTLNDLWLNGIAEIGSITFQSAGYVARYAAKKLVHGKDEEHEYQPISKKSQKNAIGKRYLEKYWTDIFYYGHVILPDGQKTSIPRYYEKWLQKHQPEFWQSYVTKTKNDKINKANQKTLKETQKYIETNEKRDIVKGNLITQLEQRKKIINQKFKQLQKHLKGDI